MEYIKIYQSDRKFENKFLALTPGGGDKTLYIFKISQIKNIECTEEKDKVQLIINGEREWANYKVTINLPNEKPGLINSKVEIKGKADVLIPQKLFEGGYPELAYGIKKEEGTIPVLPQLTYYFNGTPGAYTYHTVQNDSASIPDLNQFIYFGDSEILGSTLKYYVDFTSLNPFFKQSESIILGSVRQPSGCLGSPVRDSSG